MRKKILDLGRIGARNRPDGGFFRAEPAQGLAQASLLYPERLLHDDCATKPSIWAVSAPETAQIEGFSSPGLANALFKLRFL